ncbi:hypothetical protein F4808DRAFT_303858 [Astrocystis sublimbata]|nr:hypothetical protein F4808DRAFT_303858 [Astrocystis sublimbata]
MALDISNCHCSTGHERYRLADSVKLPWDKRCFPPLTDPVPTWRSESDLSSESDELASHISDGDTSESSSGELSLGQVEDSDQELPEEAAHLGPENAGGVDSYPVPDIADWRLNLTTLSQRYNIYAVAYGEVIHIFRVRSCVDHTLPARPDLTLRPVQSEAGCAVGGYLDEENGHYINHMIIGDLGDMEILLFACDDGDVLAYYTSHIENALTLSSNSHVPGSNDLVPFFHENVGISAWGLAVHQKSRLIGVANNSHQVHVFAMALTDPRLTDGEALPRPHGCEPWISFNKDEGGDLGWILWECKHQQTAPQKPEPHRRQYAYHLSFNLGIEGANMPNIAFSSNSEGDAVAVYAFDIEERLWILDIWSDSAPMQHEWGLYRTHSLRRQGYPRGWGVLVLPESSFLPTNTYQESLGLRPEEAKYVFIPKAGYYIDTEEAIEHIKNNSTRHPWVRARKTHRFNRSRPQRPRSKWYSIGPSMGPTPSWWNAGHDKVADNLPLGTNLTKKPLSKTTYRLHPLDADNSSVMRTYETDIELLGGDRDNPGIMFSHSIDQKRPNDTYIDEEPDDGDPDPWGAITGDRSRLANLLHVPELCLVVAGSPCGRVALVTLTRPTSSSYSFKRGFRVDAILPRTIEEDRQLRPMCPLIGVAIGPIPTAGYSRDKRLFDERRYRLMLHYMDHRILSYEVYRNMNSKELSII